MQDLKIAATFAIMGIRSVLSRSPARYATHQQRKQMAGSVKMQNQWRLN